MKERVEEWLQYTHRGTVKFFCETALPLCFVQFSWETGTGLTQNTSSSQLLYVFQLLGSYLLSTSKACFFHISSFFMSLFLPTSLYYLKTFNHLSFLIFCKSQTALTALYHSTLSRLAQGQQSGAMSNNSSAGSFVLLHSHSVENFPDTHTILVVTPPSGMPPTQFTWHFRRVWLILRHWHLSCFPSMCQRNLFFFTIQHHQQ